MLEFAFMQKAVVATIITGLLCGVLGFFVVLRRLAFVGVGISHSAIGGVALGIVLGIDPLLSAAVFATLVALGIGGTSKRGGISEDAVIGVFFSGSMALGLIILSLKRGYQQDLFGYLFGNVLSVSTGELTVLSITTVAIVGVLLIFFRELLFIAFDAEVARAYRRPVDQLNALLLVLLAITVILGVRLVGILLIEALLVIPAATAALWTKNFRTQVLVSASLGAACGIAGLMLSFSLDTAAGATMVMVAIVVFFSSLLLRPRSA